MKRDFSREKNEMKRDFLQEKNDLKASMQRLEEKMEEKEEKMEEMMKEMKREQRDMEAQLADTAGFLVHGVRAHPHYPDGNSTTTLAYRSA